MSGRRATRDRMGSRYGHEAVFGHKDRMQAQGGLLDNSSARHSRPMPPTPGLFAVPYGTTPTQTQPGIATAPSGGTPIPGPPPSHLQHQSSTSQAVAGPSSRYAGSTGTTTMNGEGKSRKRKEPPKVTKEIALDDRLGEDQAFADTISILHNNSHILSTRPEMSDLFLLRLFPLSLERSSLIAQLEFEERYSIECAQVAYEEERDRVEEEWRRGRERVRERLLEGIEERRRRAREEKEGEGIVGDAALDSHSRPPITRKLRNKLGTSPPPTPHNGSHLNGSHHPLSFPISGLPNGLTALTANGTANHNSNLPFTGPFLNPHSLSVDDLPSPFPLPLTSTHSSHPPGGSGGTSGLGGSGGPGGTAGGAGGRRRVKGGAGHQGQTLGGLGKSIFVLTTTKDNELESDLGEIRRGNKRRRATAAANAARSGVA
ncbi:hypothetical protein CPB84DRAFT_1961176 [Gymnopilus junonius]|uniref:Uncharacterized protein n=1 Tax=Gymnopilus junonius TaxID=109634 RepID=A0A9P5NT36_GYMJU|nr:hypothetical protein CPB84DRAFT_1961176 [Gymnopilus junonius]